MKLKSLFNIKAGALLLCMYSSFSAAESINLLNADNTEIQKTVIGVLATNEKITFSTSGTYSILLTDFGLTNPNFGDSFSYLGAMISSSTDNIASITSDSNSSVANKFLSFDVVAGDYWLNIFAITGSDTNVGTFNFKILEGATNPVPLPAAFWFMATSLLGLISFVRQSKAQKKLNRK